MVRAWTQLSIHGAVRSLGSSTLSVLMYAMRCSQKPWHSPGQSTDETKNTLEYALRAKNIRNRPEVNQKVSSATHMANLSGENKRLKLELTAMREKDGVFMPLALCGSLLLFVLECCWLRSCRSAVIQSTSFLMGNLRFAVGREAAACRV
jgi:hypothetical protein